MAKQPKKTPNTQPNTEPVTEPNVSEDAEDELLAHEDDHFSSGFDLVNQDPGKKYVWVPRFDKMAASRYRRRGWRPETYDISEVDKEQHIVSVHPEGAMLDDEEVSHGANVVMGDNTLYSISSKKHERIVNAGQSRSDELMLSIRDSAEGRRALKGNEGTYYRLQEDR